MKILHFLALSTVLLLLSPPPLVAQQILDGYETPHDVAERKRRQQALNTRAVSLAERILIVRQIDATPFEDWGGLEWARASISVEDADGALQLITHYLSPQGEVAVQIGGTWTELADQAVEPVLKPPKRTLRFRFSVPVPENDRMRTEKVECTVSKKEPWQFGLFELPDGSVLCRQVGMGG